MSILRALVLAVGIALGAAPVPAQEGAPDTRRPTPGALDPAALGARRLTPDELDARTRELASELRCPVCQGESIQESPAELAQEMKALVRDQLAAGKTPDEVKAYFVGRYGEWILLRPKTSGFNAMLYWLPPIALLAGAGIVIMLARRWTRANATSAATQDHVR